MTHRLVLIGKKSNDKIFVAAHLETYHKFKRMRMDEGIRKFIRYMYGYGTYVRPSWEKRYDLYDATYNIDNTIHLNYLLRKLETVTNHVVVEDVRYVSELQALRDLGFIVVRVTSPKRPTNIKGLRGAKTGTLVLAESFYDEALAAYSADYTILHEDRTSTRQALDSLLDTLDSNVV